MAKSVYIKTGLTGGSTVADLDGIDGNKLIDGDVSFVYETGMRYAHILNATSGATESSPNIITPDTNPGTKRWLLQSSNVATHATAHIIGASDEIDGDKLDIDWTPAYYTPATNATTADNLDNLSSHLKGIDTLFNTKASTTHASTHASGGSDAVKLDDLAAPDDNDHLNATTSAHGLLKKLDNDATHYIDGEGNWTVPSSATATHATTHITGASDEIDGDKVDIDWTPAYYTPATNATTADNVDHLTSHLKGIDTLLSSVVNSAVVSNTDIDTGTETVDSFADTIGDGAMWFYVVKKSTAIRTGIIMTAWNVTGDTTEYTETSTLDIGDTSDLTLAVDIDSNNVRLRATAGSDDWIVRAQRMVL